MTHRNSDRYHPYGHGNVTPHRGTPSSDAPPTQRAAILPGANPPSRPPATPPHQLQGILDKILAGVNANAAAIHALQQDLQRQTDLMDEALRSSFSIEKSGYKAELLHESSILFCKTLNRLPDQKSILGVVGKVLKAEALKKYKRTAAETFVKTRLGELRAEERRRIFGIKPCQGFLLMRCEEFVTKFLSILKVDKEEIPNYHLHVAQLRKFCRTEKSSRSMTHKGFDAWLKSNYEGGQPTAVDLQTAQDDEDSIVAPSSSIYATSPLPVPAEDGNLNDGDANLSPRSLSGY